MATDPTAARPTDAGVSGDGPDVPALAAPIRRDLLWVRGPEAVSFLQGQLSQDVAGLPVGASAATFVLQPTGKVDAWCRVTRTGDDEVLLDIEGGATGAGRAGGAGLAARLERFKLRTKADLELVEGVEGVALRGPGSSGPGAEVGLALPVDWNGVEGLDVLATPARASGDPGAGPVAVDPPEALEALRIRRGVPALGAELTEATIPAECGAWVVAASVSFTKGCYTGQELVARIDSRGGHVPRHLRLVALPGAAAPPPGSPVLVDGAEVGAITSSVVDPATGTAVALAFVARAVEPPASATVAGDPATVLALP